MDATAVARPPAETKRDDVAVKIDRAIVEKAKLVVSRRKNARGHALTLAEYFSDLLEPLVNRDWAQAADEIHRQAQQLRRKST